MSASRHQLVIYCGRVEVNADGDHRADRGSLRARSLRSRGYPASASIGSLTGLQGTWEDGHAGAVVG